MSTGIKRPNHCRQPWSNTMTCYSSCDCNPDTAPIYKLDRRKFVEHYTKFLFQLTTVDKIKEDLILGGEFIVTAEDMLSNLSKVDGTLVGLSKGVTVNPKNCVLYYEKE